MTPGEKERLLEMGEAKVRLIVTSGGFGSPLQASAVEWLAELDEAERSRHEALQFQQTGLAQSAAKAAWIAAYAAIGAVVVTVIGAIVTILAWVYPRHQGKVLRICVVHQSILNH
jgi:CHASE3 domain sensor protein